MWEATFRLLHSTLCSVDVIFYIFRWIIPMQCQSNFKSNKMAFQFARAISYMRNVNYIPSKMIRNFRLISIICLDLFLFFDFFSRLIGYSITFTCTLFQFFFCLNVVYISFELFLFFSTLQFEVDRLHRIAKNSQEINVNETMNGGEQKQTR